MWLVSIVALALAVRIAGLGDRLSADEGYSWLVASAHGWSGFLDRLAAFENTPPLFYLLLRPLPLDHEVWLRLPALIASVAAVPVLYAIARPPLGTRPALLGALALAVAPYSVAFANYSRGFSLTALGCLLALWGAARLAEGREPAARWWALCLVGGTVAVWSEYYAALFLVALAVVLLLCTRRASSLGVLLPVATLGAWAHQVSRGLDSLDETKVSPVYPGPSPAGLRDTVVPLALGEHGSAPGLALRWLELVAILAVVGGACWVLWRRSPLLLCLVAGTGALVLVLHGLAAAIGPDVFAQRYLTVLIPLAALALGAGIDALPWRAAAPLAAAALVLAGGAVIAQRAGRELEPDYARAAEQARAAHGRALLTNSAAFAFYARRLGPRLDRPFGLGREPERERECACPGPVVVVDDTRVAGGARRGPGATLHDGPLTVRIRPPVSARRSVEETGGVNSLTCALAVIAAGLGGAGPASPGADRGMETVLQDDAQLLHGSDGEVARAMHRIADAGADRVRLTAGWSALAPEPDSRKRPAFEARDSGAYPQGGWRALDRAVKLARRADLDVMIDVAFWAPRWAVKRDSRGKARRERWQPDPREFGQFAEAVAGRYDGGFPDPEERGEQLPAVRLWTTWNEPNHPGFLLPQWRQTKAGQWRPASPHIYRPMHEAAYGAIKKASGENKVLLGGLSSRGGSGPGERQAVPPLRFMRELACVDDALNPLNIPECKGFKPLQADGLAYHPYSFYSEPATPSENPDEAGIGDLPRVDELLGALAERGRIASKLPIYLTEFGYETNPPDTVRGVAPEDQARFLAQSTYLAWKQPGVKMHAQFLLQDLGPIPGVPVTSKKRWRDYQTGLYFGDGSPKPALDSFRLPFWAESRSDPGPPARQLVLAFGQVRPGRGPQELSLQVQTPSGSWHDIPTIPLSGHTDDACAATAESFKTDAEGFYRRVIPFEGVRAYRPAWKGQYGKAVTVQVPG